MAGLQGFCGSRSHRNKTWLEVVLGQPPIAFKKKILG
jgi:hypothetical protein